MRSIYYHLLSPHLLQPLDLNAPHLDQMIASISSHSFQHFVCFTFYPIITVFLLYNKAIFFLIYPFILFYLFILSILSILSIFSILSILSVLSIRSILSILFFLASLRIELSLESPSAPRPFRPKLFLRDAVTQSRSSD